MKNSTHWPWSERMSRKVQEMEVRTDKMTMEWTDGCMELNKDTRYLNHFNFRDSGNKVR